MSDDIRLDLEREARIGIAEAVFCAGKSTDQIARIIRDDPAQRRLFTRLAPEQLAALPAEAAALLTYDPLSRTAVLGALPALAGPARVAIVAAGTSDLPIVAEATRTLAFFGHRATPFLDCGVAGLWRLLEQQAAIGRHPVVIAVAGMEGALFSVLGGLVRGVLIAVPSSIGYGVARDGCTALAAALASCAPGITVVNIDNGYGAACAALRVLGALEDQG
jgi:pyridinium-3,5-biscarboxylic acid mononucleotide synthase